MDGVSGLLTHLLLVVGVSMVFYVSSPYHVIRDFSELTQFRTNKYPEDPSLIQHHKIETHTPLMASSSVLSPPSVSCSLPEPPPSNRFSSLRHHPFSSSKTQQGKLILLATLSFCTRNSTALEALNLVHKNELLPRKPFDDLIKGNHRLQQPQDKEKVEKEEENHVLVHENGELPTSPNLDIVAFNEENKRNQTKFEEPIEGKLGSGEKNGSFEVMGSVQRVGRLVGVQGIKDGRVGNIHDFNNILMGLVKEDETQLAVEMFNELPSYGLVPDSRTFSIMIRCYCKKNEGEEAKRVLDEMVGNGFHPNVVTCTILINSFCRRGKLQKASEVFEVMSKIGCEPTVQTYNCLINGLCYVGRVEEAFELLMKIKKSPKKPDIYTYTAVMDGFCKVGRSDEAMELLEEALKEGLKPSAVTFNTLFNGYCKEGRPLEGINLLKQMREQNCQPDYISYNTLLHGLLKWNEVQAALQVYKEMLEIGLEVNERIVNNLLRVICRKSWTNEKLLKDVEEVFERIKKARLIPYPNTYCLVIQALSIGGEAEKAWVTLQEMTKLEYRPSLITYNAVIRSLCKKGMVDEGLLVLVLMIYGSAPSSRISYNLLIDEFNRRGRSLDASKVYGAALKRGVVPNHEPRKMLEE